MRLKRLIVTCGGTGGHFYPGLSIARNLKADGGTVLLLLSGVNSEKQAEIADSFGIPAVVLPKMPSPRRAPWQFVRGLFSGYSGAVKTIRAFAPQAILGMGSFAQLPVVLAALRLKVALALHDGNARIGKANRLLSRFAGVLGCGFPAVNGKSCHCPLADVGMPVRPELLKYRNISKADAVRELGLNFAAGLDPERPVILIFGGSQGAAVFNSVLPAALKSLADAPQVLHLTGRGKLEETKAAYGETKFPRLLLENHEHMEWFLGAADLVFCRAGGSSLAEIALFGKPAVLIPYPYASEGHQQDNAEYFLNAEAAEVVKNGDFTEERAAEVLQDFMTNPDQWQLRGKHAAALARPAAAEAMLQEISRLGGGGI